MNSYRPNNRRSPFLGVAIAVAALCVAIFLLDMATSGRVRQEVQQAGGAARLVAASARSAIHDNALFATRRTLQQENDALQREISVASERLQSYQFLRDENEALRALVNLAREESGVTARVISSYRSTPYGSFMIDAGSREGIFEGALVLTEGGYVAGRITSVSERNAIVRTVFAPGEQIDLIVGDVAFTADGKGGGNAEAVTPREAELEEGDVARAPAFGNRAAGVIGRIETASSSATQSVFLRLPVNLGLLQFVHVVSR